jgi:penicillin-binding protein 2
VGEIQEAQLARPEFAGLEAGAHVGQTGVERAYNTYLMGTDGRRNVVVNSRGREIAELGVVPPVEGSRLQLTVDRDLQRALESSFAGLDLTGAAVVLAPATGEVLAMTSLPAFDPNEFAQGIGARRFAELNRDPRKLFQNKLLQGRYAPGSTFKIVMALAGLGERVITPEHTEYCPGFLTAYGRTWQCSRKAGHGTVDLKRALQHSCNVYFYKLGDRLSVDQVHAYSERLGLTTRTGVDLPGEGESIIPSTEWKRRVHGDRWYPGETLSVAIGQGYVTVTPIAMAAMVAAVANGGTVVTPHVLKAVDEGQGWQPFARPEPRRATPIDAADRAAVIDGLWRVVNEPGGTAYASRLQGRDLVGKTGTAQTISLEGARKAAGKIDTRDNAWFVFFAPRDNPQIAGVVFAEAGLHGSSAAPIAKHVVDTYFAKLEGRPLPAAPRLAVAAATPAPTGAPGPGGTAVAFGPGAGRAGRR